MYFTKGTENAIVRYNKTTDDDERNRIYSTEIQKPLDKLAENIINRFKFPYMQGSFQDVKDQVVSFLVLNLHKYAEDKGKAFSYLSVIAKNYLILNNNNRYKQEKRSMYFSDLDDGQMVYDDALVVDMEVEESKKDMAEFSRLMVSFWDHNLTRVFKKKKDMDIANAVVELFRRADGIENFNKKALYLMIREMTGQKTSAVTKIVNKMAKFVEQHLKEFRQTGTITDAPKYFQY